MTTTVYPIYREISRPMTFNGLVEQYILYTAIGMVADLLLFVVLYLCKLPLWFCMPFALLAGAANLFINLRFSKRYGVYGLLKLRARKRVPARIRWKSRYLFLDLKR